MRQNTYRTHTCGALRASDIGSEVRLSGWVHALRDHRGVLFIALRDRYGLTQAVLEEDAPEALKALAWSLKLESTITVSGVVAARPEGQVNDDMATGAIEIRVTDLKVWVMADTLPFQVNREEGTSEDLRLRYRFLDLRRERLQRNIAMRAKIIGYIRRFMESEGFLDIHTPILANSSPEGARDYLVPSRIHPGMFYALPQAPQQFKQLLMVAGFDRYYQIAPCFRDEDPRADRSPGEFYQLDFEMSFAEQDDVLDVVERLMTKLTLEVGEKKLMAQPFPRFTWAEVMARYGSDKPDLRPGMEIEDVSDLLSGSEFRVVQGALAAGKAVRGICVKGGSDISKSAFKRLETRTKELGAQGLMAVGFTDAGSLGMGVGKFFSEAERGALASRFGATPDDVLFLVADAGLTASKILGALRMDLARERGLLDSSVLAWGFVTGFPMFEYDEKAQKIDFGHNPLSMPQGGLEALNTKDPLEILAYQYDVFCNGLELSSGAVRNYDPEIMRRAFQIAGYPVEEIERQFGHMVRAFGMGAPPHAGMAPGIERIVMLMTDESVLREVVPFPKNQQVQDVMLGAPSRVEAKQLEEVHIRIVEPKAK